MSAKTSTATVAQSASRCNSPGGATHPPIAAGSTDMNSRMFSVCAALTAALAIPSVSRAEKSSCIDGVERASQRMVFNLSHELERKNLVWDTQFQAIRDSLDLLDDHENSASTRACLAASAATEAHYQSWKQRYAVEVIEQANARAGEICSLFGADELDASARKIDRLVAAGKMLRATTAVAELEAALSREPMIAECAPLAQRVDRLRTEYIPSIRAAAAIPAIAGDMWQSYVAVVEPYRAAAVVFGSSGATIQPVPDQLATEVARAEFSLRAHDCVAKGLSLGELGAADTDALVDENDTDLGDARRTCEEIAAGIDELFERASAHDAAYQQVQRKRWEHVNIKGWGMQTVYDAHGIPDSIDAARAELIWSYAATCKRYRFTIRGQLLGDDELTACKARE